MVKFTRTRTIKTLALALILMIIAGILAPQAALAFPQNGHGFYGSVTTLEGSPVPYDPANPEDPAHTTMVYAKDVTRVLNFDGEPFSSGQYFGRPVTLVAGDTVYGYTPQAFIFPAYDPQDTTVQGARPGDQIEFYICAPGMDLPGVLVTDELGAPIRQTFAIGGLTELDLSADIIAPAPEAVSPEDGAVDVLKDAPVTVLFNEDVSLEDATAFTISGSRSGDLLADGDATLGDDNRTVTLPHLPFSDYGETITVTLALGLVSDGVGNLNEVYSWSFETYPYFFTISGNAGVAGVELRDGDGVLLATADDNGDYSFPVENGWSGTVTPELEGYLFDPAFREYTNVTADQPDQDYEATLMTFTISGNAEMEGVELKDGDGDLLATADAAGDYSFTVDYGWSGTVTPVLEGYMFDPAFIEYENVDHDFVDQDYTATKVLFYIYLPLVIND